MLSQPNKTLSQFVSVFLLILLLSACDSRPRGVMNEKKMTEVFTELHKLDGVLFEKGILYGQYLERNKYYIGLLKKYDITQAEFDSSLVWYTKHPKKYEKIYENVLVNLTQLDKDIKSGKYHHVDSTTASKINLNIWNKRTLYNLTKDSARTHLDFEITNNNLMLGDVYELKFLQRIARVDSSKNQHVVLRINYINGKSDSAYSVTHNDNLLRRYTLRLTALKKQRIKSISGELLGSTAYKGTLHAKLDSISLIRYFDTAKQDSLRKEVENYTTVNHSLRKNILIKK